MNQLLKDVLSGKESNYLLPFFWQHDGHKDQLRDRIRQISDSGCRAFCLESRPFEDFCGETWWENLEIILDEAQKRDMKVWILDDKHFPTGYANGIIEKKYPERRRWFLWEHHVDLMGPAQDMSVLIPATGEDMRLVCACAFRRGTQGQEIVGEPIPLSVEPEDKFLYLDLPEGCWRIFFVFKRRKQDSNYMNMLSKEGPQALIEAVYEPHYQRFGKYFGNTLAGFFSDEPSLDAPFFGPWGTDPGFYYRTVGHPGTGLPWDELLAEKLKREGPKGIEYMLPTLWYPHEQAAADTRLRYMDGVTQLWRENFSMQLGDWCREHGVMYIGHIIEDMNAHGRMGCSAGHFFRALDGQDMSGIDIVLHQVMPGMGEYQTAAAISQGFADPEFFHYVLAQLAASQARQNPAMQGRAMCEVFGAFGWAEGADFMKWLMDFLLVRGVNHFVPHAFTDFFPDPDCPPHFSCDGQDTQFSGFSALMRYVNRAAHLLYGSDMAADGAILYHAEAEWMNGCGCMTSQAPAKACYDAHIPYEIASIDYLLAGNSRGYKFLIVPSCRLLPEKFWEAAKRLKDEGTKIFFIAPEPQRQELPGEVLQLQELSARLKALGLCHDYKCGSPLLRIARFDREAANAFFLFNESPQKARERIGFPIKGRYLCLDLLTDCCEYGETADGTVELELAPGESKILMWGALDDDEWELFPRLRPWRERPGECVESWDISIMEQGKTDKFAPYKHGSKLFNITGKDGLPEFSGQIRYKGRLDLGDGLKDQEELCLDLGQVGTTAELIVNGHSLGVRITPPYRFDITGVVEPGVNEIEVVAANTMVHRMQDPLSQFMAIPPSGMLGPVRLMDR